MSIEFRDPVHGSITLSDGETLVIESAEFQRLRAIKQLGFADVSFPGATHTRFLHSLGVCFLAGEVFDSVFKTFPFSKPHSRSRLRQCFRLAALLHDVGHGPLSHTTEEVMPALQDLKIEIYKHRNKNTPETNLAEKNIRASHEDFTIKYLTDSPLTQVLKMAFSDIEPYHIASLIDKTFIDKDDFFIEQGLDFRPILSQLVSSELDVDRMDYLERDSYYTGTNYGKIDLHWLISNLATNVKDDKMYLALNRRALYTFDDFLLSRHHIHLMVYFHHKAIIFEEMLNNYLTSKDCTFHLPADINLYTKYNDFKLYEHLAESKNIWAERISQRKAYKVLVELHTQGDSQRLSLVQNALNEQGIHNIWSSSKARLSKYHSNSADNQLHSIYVVDQYDKWDKPISIDQSSEIFQKYEGARVIDRIYVSPEDYRKAEKVVISKRY